MQANPKLIRIAALTAVAGVCVFLLSEQVGLPRVDLGLKLIGVCAIGIAGCVFALRKAAPENRRALVSGIGGCVAGIGGVAVSIGMAVPLEGASHLEALGVGASIAAIGGLIAAQGKRTTTGA